MKCRFISSGVLIQTVSCLTTQIHSAYNTDLQMQVLQVASATTFATKAVFSAFYHKLSEAKMKLISLLVQTALCQLTTSTTGFGTSTTTSTTTTRQFTTTTTRTSTSSTTMLPNTTTTRLACSTLTWNQFKLGVEQSIEQSLQNSSQSSETIQFFKMLHEHVHGQIAKGRRCITDKKRV